MAILECLAVIFALFALVLLFLGAYAMWTK